MSNLSYSVPTEDTPPHATGALISLRLLDAVQGHAIQTWNFDRNAVVQIGRLEDSAVMICDPLVSRVHATLKHVDGHWELVSQGKHGVIVNDRRVETVRLNHEMTFRLGPKGPTLVFIELERAANEASQTCQATVEIDSHMIEMLRIDQEQTQQQVREIIDNEGFGMLLERAKALREKRSMQDG